MSIQDNLNAAQAKGWRPEEGDILIGKLVAISAGWSDYQQSEYPILTVLDEAYDKPVAVHCFHAVLLNRLLELKPRVGERIGIKYSGQVPSKDGRRTISVYTVKVDGREVERSWDSFGGQARAQTDVPVDTADFQPHLPEGQAPPEDDIPF